MRTGTERAGGSWCFYAGMELLVCRWTCQRLPGDLLQHKRTSRVVFSTIAGFRPACLHQRRGGVLFSPSACRLLLLESNHLQEIKKHSSSLHSFQLRACGFGFWGGSFFGCGQTGLTRSHLLPPKVASLAPWTPDNHRVEANVRLSKRQPV